MEKLTNGRIISRRPGLTVAELSGGPYGMGLAHGRLFAAEIAFMRRALVNYLSSFTLGVGGRALLYVFGLLSRRMEPFVPGWLKDEMRGVAEGSGQPYRFIFLLNCLDDVLVNLSSCSAVAIAGARTADGGIVVGRNLDYPLFHDVLPSLNTVFLVRPDKGRPFVSAAWPGFSGVVTGINDAGLFLADLTSISMDRTMRGTPALLVNRMAVQGSAGLDELEDIIRAARRTVGKNLMAASAEGARVLEVTATRFASVPMGGSGVLACTNHFRDEQMASLQGSVRTPPKSDFPDEYYSYAFSRERLDALLYGVGEVEGGIDGVVSALSREPVANRSTVQCVVYQPATGRLLVAARESAPVSQGHFTDLTGLL